MMSSKLKKFIFRKETWAITVIILTLSLFIPQVSPMPDFFLHYDTGKIILQGRFEIHPFTNEHWNYMDELGKLLVFFIGNLLPKDNIVLSIRIFYLILLVFPALLLALPKDESPLLTLLIPLIAFSFFVFTDLRPVLFTYPLLAMMLTISSPAFLFLAGLAWTGIHGSWAVGAFYLSLKHFNLNLRHAFKVLLWYILGVLSYSVAYYLFSHDIQMTFHKLTSGVYWLLYFPKFGEWGAIGNLTGVTLTIMMFIIVAILDNNLKTGISILPSIMLARLSPYSIIFAIKNTNWKGLERKFNLRIKKPFLWSLATSIFLALMLDPKSSFYDFKQIKKLAESFPTGTEVATLPPQLCYALFFYNDSIVCGPSGVYKIGAELKESEQHFWNYLMYKYPCELGNENYLIIAKHWGQDVIPAMSQCGVKVSKVGEFNQLEVFKLGKGD